MKNLVPYSFLVILVSLVPCRSLENDIDIHSRIIGGRVARKNEVPWQAGLRMRNTGTFGGAVIIDDHWLLTAGHCVINGQNKPAWKNQDLEIVIGGRDLREAHGNPWVVHAVKAIPHPQYQGAGGNDIALIKTKESMRVNESGFIAKPARLPNPEENFAWKKAVASGYGATENGHGSAVVKVVDFTIYDTKKCKELNPNFNETGQICAGDNSHGTAGGDSGGPIVVRYANNAILAGITSFGYGSGSFYTRVSHYIPFIRRTIASG